MSDCKRERVNINFLVKLKKSATETFQLLTEAYGEDCMSRARMFEWHERFSEGRKSLKDQSFQVQGSVVFFDIQGTVMAEWVPSGQMVNQQYYIEVLTKLCEKETTGIMEKRVDFAPGQCASPQRIACEAIFS